MKVVTVLGARPQFVKATVVSAAFARVPGLQEVLVHTGQHFDPNMSRVFFDELGIPEPAHHLGVAGGLHGEMTGRMLEAVERVLLSERPDAVLVYGDTNSTLAGALAAAKLHIPVAHVEAGLRSFNRRMPEEINRVLTDHASRWLFAPTQAALAQLGAEGIAASQCEQVGDVMFDACLFFRSQAEARSRILERLALAAGAYVLVTTHRAENTDRPERLEAILDGIRLLAAERPVVWPVHPRVRKLLAGREAAIAASGRVLLTEPLGYLDMTTLEANAAVVATDSGGVQKEAFFYGVPCVTLRDETEWVELVAAGWNRLVPPDDGHAIAQAVLGAIGTRGAEIRPYGDGDAARRIAARLRADLGAA